MKSFRPLHWSRMRFGGVVLSALCCGCEGLSGLNEYEDHRCGDDLFSFESGTEGWGPQAADTGTVLSEVTTADGALHASIPFPPDRKQYLGGGAFIFSAGGIAIPSCASTLHLSVRLDGSDVAAVNGLQVLLKLNQDEFPWDACDGGDDQCPTLTDCLDSSGCVVDLPFTNTDNTPNCYIHAAVFSEPSEALFTLDLYIDHIWVD